jgi:hypothetical protein
MYCVHGLPEVFLIVHAYVSDRTKLTAEKYDALKHHVLIDSVGCIFRKAVSTN